MTGTEPDRDWHVGLAGPRPVQPRTSPPTTTHREAGVGLATIDEAIEAIRNGEIIIVVDDADRENEGDFVMAADWASPAAVNFMITEGRGLLCLPMTGQRLDELGLGPMVPELAGRGPELGGRGLELSGRGPELAGLGSQSGVRECGSDPHFHTRRVPG